MITRNIKEIYRKLSYILNKKQKNNCILILILIIFGSFWETLGVSSILPLIQAMLSPSDLIKNRVIMYISNIISIRSTNDLLLLICIGVILIYILKNIFLLLSSYVQIKFKLGIQRDLSVFMLKSYLNRPYTFFIDANSSEILRGINSDVFGVFSILENIFKLITEVLVCILIGSYILYTDFYMAIGIIILAIFCVCFIILGFKNKAKAMGEKERNAFALANKYAYESVHGVKEILVLKRSEKFLEKYKKAYDEKCKADSVHSFIGTCPERIIEGVCVSGMIGLIGIRILSGIDTSLFVPKLAVFAVAAFRIMPSVSRISGYVSSLIFYRPALEAAHENIKKANEYQANIIINGKKVELQQNISLQKSIEIKDIYWKYNDAENNVLDGLSLEINKGEAVALIGSSGAGKTTLSDIVLGLLPPQKGHISIDSIRIDTIPTEWSKIIGYVPQSVFLLDDTIKNNILFGLNEEENVDEDIWIALDQAQLKEFVENLPNKLETVVGERGVKFSGGQRQRIAIARALFHKPEILILDEATSALDSETELAVMQAIEILRGKKTLIIVAHRLSTIKNCDKIYEIINGKAILRSKEEILSR